MPVTLDQILDRHPAVDLPDLRARGGARWSGRRRSVPRHRRWVRALRRGAVRRHRRSEASVASAGSIRDDLDPAERAARYARAGRGGDLGPHRRAVLRRLGRRPPRGGRPVTPSRCCGRTSFSTSFRSWRRVRRAPRRCCSSFGRSRLSGSRACSPRPRDAGSTHWSRCTRATELARALDAGADILGVNSRDLDTFRIDTASAWTCSARYRPACVAVAESGMDERGGRRARRRGRRRRGAHRHGPLRRRRSWRSARAAERRAPPWPLTSGQDLRPDPPRGRGRGRGGGSRLPGRRFCWGSAAGHRPRGRRGDRGRGRRSGPRRLRRSARRRSPPICRAGRASRGAQLHGPYGPTMPRGFGRGGSRLASAANCEPRGPRPPARDHAWRADAVLIEPRVPAAGRRRRCGARPGPGGRGAGPAPRRRAWPSPAGSRRRPSGGRGPRSARCRGCKFRGGIPPRHQGPRQDRALSGGGAWTQPLSAESSVAGRFGPYGGRYVPETLVAALDDLAALYDAVRVDPAFWAELRGAAGRVRGPALAAHRGAPPRRGSRRAGASSSARTSTTPARTRSTTRSARRCSPGAWASAASSPRPARDSTGSRPPQCAPGSGSSAWCTWAPRTWRARRSTCIACSCSARRWSRSSPGTRTLKDATNEALRDWVTNVPTTHYIIGSVVGPDPYPADGARLPGGHRPRGAGADARAHRAAAAHGGGLRGRRLQRDRHLHRLPRRRRRGARRRRGRRLRTRERPPQRDAQRGHARACCTAA